MVDTTAVGSGLEALKRESEAALSPIEGELRVAGLSEAVSVLRDTYGIPHIYARNYRDLFFAQGFVQAQDRLWQMEIWRRQAEGRMAEIGGASWVARDTLARLVAYRGDMKAEWEAYGPHAHEIAASFAAGVNAWLDACAANLPVEFRLMGIRPGYWSAETCLGRSAGFMMVRNVSQELLRAILLREIGAAETAKLFPTDPERPLEGRDIDRELDALDPALLDLLASLNAPLKLPMAATAPAPAVAPTPDGSGAAGSNNWTIAGRLTASGKPILANDPHRGMNLPSLRYVVHLVCPATDDGPAWNVIGASEPAIPGVTIGHNERIAWGITIVNTDQADLYVEELDAADPGRYRGPEGWLAVRTERQELRVLGEPEPRSIELRFTRHGPIVHEDRAKSRAFALRWTGAEAGGAGYMGGLRLDQAQDWDGLKDAAGHWDIPSSNIAYADIDGHIGWIAAAATPVRRNGDGIMPVPGSSDAYEWERRLTVDELPQKFDPPEGYIATANSNILPPDYPHTITYDWTSPNRIHRIDEAMKATPVHDLDTSRRLQLDVTSLPARRLVPLLAQAGGAGDETAALREMLEGWDCQLQAESAAAALYEAWQARLIERVVRPRIPARVWAIYANRPPVDALIRLLESPDEGFGADPAARRDAILVECLAEAAADLEKSLGPRSSWAWGQLHQMEFTHPLSPVAAPSSDAESNVATLFDLAPVARGGDAQTPMATSGPGYRQSYGASYAQVFDLSDWDKGLVINTPGQSAQPGSPHYGDLLDRWAAGDYFPLAFSSAAVEAATKHSLELRPA